MSAIGRLRRRSFGIPSAEAVFRRPGFAPAAWTSFEPVAVALMEGYHATLEDARFPRLAARLDAVEPALQGFAYEGAGMGLAALDAVAPWNNRVAAFAAGPAAGHLYPFYVGVGLAYARLRRMPENQLARLDPLLGWVTADGYGFHEIFFRRARYLDQHAVPRRLTGYGQRMFDQGVGRALWFSGGAEPVGVGALIAGFPAHRHGDIWGGVGLAAAYGGGIEPAGLRTLVALSDRHAARLGRGAAIAAWGRHRAGNPAPHTELASEILAGRTAVQLAGIVERARKDLPVLSRQPLHETWRLRIDDELQLANRRAYQSKPFPPKSDDHSAPHRRLQTGA